MGGLYTLYYSAFLLFCIQPFENLLRQRFFDFIVSRHRFRDAILGIYPDGVIASLPLQKTASNSESAFQVSAVHPTRIFSCIASSGRPRKISPRRSSRISSMASMRFCFVSLIVSPCPFAPGTSGQIAQYPPSGALSMIAVNSAFMGTSYPVRARLRVNFSRPKRPVHPGFYHPTFETALTGSPSPAAPAGSGAGFGSGPPGGGISAGGGPGEPGRVGR